MAQHEERNASHDEVDSGADGGMQVAGPDAAGAVTTRAVDAAVPELLRRVALGQGADDHEDAVSGRHGQRAPDDVFLDGVDDDTQQEETDGHLDQRRDEAVEASAYVPVLH